MPPSHKLLPPVISNATINGVEIVAWPNRRSLYSHHSSPDITAAYITIFSKFLIAINTNYASVFTITATSDTSLWHHCYYGHLITLSFNEIVYSLSLLSTPCHSEGRSLCLHNQSIAIWVFLASIRSRYNNPSYRENSIWQSVSER